MHGICFDFELQEWFDFKIPHTTIPSDYIVSCLESDSNFSTKPSAKIIWIGGQPIMKTFTKSKKGKSFGNSPSLVSREMMKLTFHDKSDTVELSLEKDKANWLVNALVLLSVSNEKAVTFSQLKANFEDHFPNFELFWHSKSLQSLKEFGLLSL